MLIDTWFPVHGGGQVHVWEVSKRLVNQHDCEVDIITRKLSYKGKKFTENESYFSGKLNIYRIALPTSFKSLFNRMLYIVLAPFHARKEYDVIHAHAYYAAYPGKIIKFLRNLPLILTVHGIAIPAREEMDKGLVSKIKSKMEDKTLFGFRYDCEISVDSSIFRYKNVNDNIKIIPNGVDVEKFDRIQAEKSDNFKILFVGRFHPQKGIKYLISAAEKVVKEYPEVEFHLIGWGPQERELKLMVKENNLQSYFKFRGEITGDELIKEYKSSHLFVLPSIYEGQPLTLLEAWAAKLPVVVTNVGSNKDFIQEGKNGYMVDPGNTEQLTKSIKKAMENENLEEMGLKGYRLVKDNYTWDKVVERTYGIYKEVV